jgi:hypothetical protein
MEIKKYIELREKIKSKDFEGKNKSLNTTLFFLSFIGNIGSIFFAYFLLNPAFYKAISANITTGDSALYISGFLTVLVLGIFEIIKRKILGNLSFDLVKNNHKLTKNFVGWVFFGVALVGSSFYFSLNGAKNFATTSTNKNILVEQNIDGNIDSLNNLYAEYKQTYLDDNASLREDNKELRDRIAETPLNYRTIRNGIQDIVKNNVGTIESNLEEISKLDDNLKIKILDLSNKLKNKIDKNNNEDVDNVLLFLVISTSIEFIIIFGVYFRQYYDYNVYQINQGDMEDIVIKRDRYEKLLKFIYKEGTVTSGQPIMGLTKLKELIKEKSQIASANKFVEEFISETKYMGIFKTKGNRTYTSVNYEEALKKIDKFDETIRLIEKLR